MKNFFKYFGSIVFGTLLIAGVVSAATILFPTGGGTGTGNVGGIQAGTVLIGSGTAAMATTSDFTFSISGKKLTATYASTTAVSATTICLTLDTCRTSWPTGGSGAYPFPLTGNATSTLTQFNAGITAYATSTIGDGSIAGGLTVSGNSTTTGNMYVGGFIGINTPAPTFSLDVAKSGGGGTGVNLLRLINVAGSGSGGGTGPQSYTGVVPTAAGDRLGYNLFGYTDGTTNRNSIGTFAYADQAWTAGTNQGSYFTIETTPDNSASRTERVRVAANGNVGISSTTPTYTLSVGNANTGTFGISTTTNGCVQATNGLFWITGTNCGTGGSNSDPFTHPGANQSASTSQFAFGTSTIGLSQTTISSSTGAQVSLSAGAGLSQWVFRNAGGNLYVATSTIAGTATSTGQSILTVLNDGDFGFGTSSPWGEVAINASSQTNEPTLAIVASNTGNATPAVYVDGVPNTGNADMGLSRANNTGTEANIDFDTAGSVKWQIGLQNNSTDDFELWNGSDKPAFTIKNSNNLEMGIGSSTPFAKFGIHLNNGETTPFAFSIGSSTVSATTTLFTVDNTGSVSVNDISGDFRFESTASLGFGYFGLTNTGEGDIFIVDPFGRTGIATTTPQYLLTVATSTAPQIALSNGAGFSQFVLRNDGANFTISTTTVAGTATSTVPALKIDTNGKIIANCFSNDGSTCISGSGGSGTVSSGLAGQLGYYNSSGTTIVGTSTNPLYVTALTATSSTATSTFLGNVLITDGTNYGFVTGAQPLEISGTNNFPYQAILANKSSGGNALSGWDLANANSTNNANPFLSTYYAAFFMAGTGFNTYPGLLPNDAVLVNSDGNLRLAALSTNQASSSISFSVGPGFTSANYDMVLQANPTKGVGYLGISTTSPKFPLHVNSTTTAQVLLTDGINNGWAFRSAGGNLYFATTSPTTYATSSVSALRIDPNGKVTANCFTNDGTTCITSGGAGTNYLTSSTSALYTYLNTGTFLSAPAFLATSTTATSTIANANGKLWVPWDYNINGCAGDPTKKDFGACVNALYALGASKGLAMVNIGVPAMVVPSANWTTAINFGTNGIGASLQCEKGGVLIYGGTATSTLWNGGNPTGHTESDNYGCIMQGQTSRVAAGNTNSNTTVGIGIGGANGGVGIHFRDWDLNGFGQNIHISNNAYMLSFDNVNSTGGNGGVLGNLLYIDKANNSGERNDFGPMVFTDPGNSIEDNAIYVTSGATASNFFHDISIDDAQVFTGASNGIQNWDKIHIENAAFATYGRYTPFISASSDTGTLMSFTNIVIANDTSGANSFDTIFSVGGPVNVNAVLLANYGSGTVSNLVDHSTDNGVSHDHVCQVQVISGSLTNIIAGSGGVAYSRATGGGCVDNTDNSYSIGLRPLSSNTNEFFSGSTVTGTFDHNGNWTLGVAAVPSTVTIQKNLSVVSAATIGTTLGVTGLTTMSYSSTTGASFAYASSTLYFGANLTSCNSASNALTWNAGVFGCNTISGSGGGSDPFTHQFAWTSATTSSLAFGTSTISNGISATLTLASSTASQINLSAGAGLAQWFQRNAGGNFYLGTTTVAGTATTSTSALTIIGSNGFIGMGTSSPRTALDLDSNNSGGGVFSIQNTNSAGYSSFDFYDDTTTRIAGVGVGGSGVGAPYKGNFYAGTNSASQDFVFLQSGTESMRLVNNGRLAVGTTTALWPVDLFSSTQSQLALSAGAGIAQWTARNAGGNLYFSTTTVAGTATSSIPAITWLNTGQEGIGTSSPFATLSINAGAGVASYFAIGSSSSQVMSVSPSASTLFGIGTTTPTAEFSVDNASSTAGTAQGTPFGSLLGMIINAVRYMVRSFDYYGHMYTSGPAPVLTSCGTSPSFVGSGNDSDMVVQVGSVAATGCTITFAYPYLTAPRVNITNRSMSVVNAMTYTVSTTQIVVSQTGLTSAILDISVEGTR